MDNNNRINFLHRLCSWKGNWDLINLSQLDPINQMIPLTVIPLSGPHCNMKSLIPVAKKSLFESWAYKLDCFQRMDGSSSSGNESVLTEEQFGLNLQFFDKLFLSVNLVVKWCFIVFFINKTLFFYSGQN